MANNNTSEEEKNLTQDDNQSATTNAVSEEQQKLNAVRDLLFGQNVQEYRSEFGELKKIINEEKSNTDQAAADLKSELVERIDKLEQSLNGKLEETTRQLTEKLDKINDSKADRKKMAAILHKLASSLED